MIGELRLKVDGMQKELQAQNKRLEEGARFSRQFHNDLRVAVQVLSLVTTRYCAVEKLLHSGITTLQ